MQLEQPRMRFSQVWDYKMFKKIGLLLSTLTVLSSASAAFAQGLMRQDVVRELQYLEAQKQHLTNIRKLGDYFEVEFDNSNYEDIFPVYQYLTKGTPLAELISPRELRTHVMNLDSDEANEVIIHIKSRLHCDGVLCPLMVLKANEEKQEWEILYQENVNKVYYSPDLDENGHKTLIARMRNSQHYLSFNPQMNEYRYSPKNFSEEVVFEKLSDMDKDSLDYNNIQTVLKRDLGEKYLILENSDPDFTTIKVGKGDLNKDDNTETFIYFQNKNFCNSSNECEMIVYDKLESKPSFYFKYSFDNFYIGKKLPGDLSNISLLKDDVFTIYKWNNQKYSYEYSETIK